MKLEDALIKRIADAGLGVPGKNLFHSHMPAKVNAGTLVLTRVPIVVDPYTGMRKGPFQVICRDLEIELAHNKASQLMKALVSEGVTVGGVRFLFIKANNEPLVFPRTEGAQFEAAVNYNFAANWE
ncbi:MAG: minor capsid protein [Pseudomonas sp.]